MKALTIKQPWGSLMFTPVYDQLTGLIVQLGLKTMETRKWPTRYRGDLLITTSQKPDKNYKPLPGDRFDNRCRHCGCTQFNACQSDTHDACSWVGDHNDLCSACKESEMHGHAIGIVSLVECRVMTVDDEKHTGCKLYQGAYCFYLQNPRAIRPFPIKGKLGIWSVDLEDEEKIKIINQPVHSIHGEVPFNGKLVTALVNHD